MTWTVLLGCLSALVTAMLLPAEAGAAGLHPGGQEAPESGAPIFSLGKPINLGGGDGAKALAIAPNGKTAYVVLGSALTTVNIATGKVGPRIELGEHNFADSIAFAPDGSTAYVIGETGSPTAAGWLMPIAVPSNRVGTPIPLGVGEQPEGQGPSSLAITQDGKWAYVTVFGDDSVVPVDLATRRAGRPIRLPSGSGPSAIAIGPSGRTAYVTDEGTSALTAVNLASGRPGAAISMGAREAPDAVAVAPDGTTVYVADHYGYIVPVSTAKNKPEKAIYLGGVTAPDALAVTPDGRWALVDNLAGGDSTVTPFATATGKTGTSLSLGLASYSYDIAIAPDGKTAYALTAYPSGLVPITITP
ncbi:MAG TPA: YncE family protein [Acidimicrobiales bacterium]|nr:YncE family protein [Acidimicrobiales bacterium]